MASANTGACYNRDGSLNTDIAYQPCSNSTSHSYCCGTNHQGAGRANVANDVCESNGLCQNYEAYDGTNEGVKLWWRQSCTDPTWQSPYCLSNVCNTSEWQDENAPVNSCGDNRWCCGPKSCCSTSSSIFALAATIGPTGASTSPPPAPTPTTPGESQISGGSSTEAPPNFTNASDTNAAPTPTATGSASFAPGVNNVPGGGGGLSTGAKAGIGAGVSVGVILVLIIVVLALQLRKKSKAAEKDSTDTTQFIGSQEKNQTITYAHDMPPVELSADSGRAELGHRDTAEMPEYRGQSELLGSENHPVEMDTHDKK